ncbi:MAG: hypothetical protein ACYDFT_01470 [Thermoplasmata archaeon]
MHSRNSVTDPPPTVEATTIRLQHLPAPPPPPLRPSLPVGVALIAVAMGVGAVLALLAGALVLLNSLLGDSVVPSSIFIVKSLDTLSAAVLVLLGAALLALARALFDLERWSLYLTVGLLFLGDTYLFFTGSLTVLFLLLLVLFMYLLTVRHHFY